MTDWAVFYRIIYGTANINERANVGCITFTEDGQFGSWVTDKRSRATRFLGWGSDDSMWDHIQAVIERFRSYDFEQRKTEHTHYMSCLQVQEPNGSIREGNLDDLAKDIGQRFTGERKSK